MMMLGVLVGSPFSLNLRNLTWHGFIKPEELPPHYITVLLCLIATLSTKIKNSHDILISREYLQIPLQNLLPNMIQPKIACQDGLIAQVTAIANQQSHYLKSILQCGMHKFVQNR